MATKDENGKWVDTELDKAKKACAKAEVEINRAVNYNNGENWVDKDGQLHKPNGQFAKGNKPKTTFADRPQDIGNGAWKPENTPSYQYRRFYNMDKDEFIKYCKVWGLVNFGPNEKLDDEQFANIPRNHTIAEETGCRRVLEGITDLSTTKEITNRIEGMPVSNINATVENKYAQLTPEELKALARAEFGE